MFIIDNKVYVSKDDIIDGRLVIGKNISHLEKICFNDKDLEFQVEELTIEDSVKSFSYYAFEECRFCKKIVLSDSIEEIPHGAFSKMFLLKEVQLPKKLKYIDNIAFMNCGALVSLDIPSSVEYIGNSAFSFSGLESISLPNNLTIISSSAFNGCRDLKEVKFPLGLKRIENYAFENTAVEEVILNNDVEYIGSMAFQKCLNLKKVILSDKLESISSNCFSHCIKLESVQLKDQIKCIDEEAFLGCDKLKFINIPSSVKLIKRNAFSKCCSLMEIDIPNSVKRIEIGAFESCVNLEKIIFNEGLIHIGQCAFANCKSLKEVLIPKSVEKIETAAFSGCNGFYNFQIYSDTKFSYSSYDIDSMTIVNKFTGEKRKVNTIQATCFGETKGIMLYDYSVDKFCFFDVENNWVEIDKGEIEKYDREIPKHRYNDLYEWVKQGKFIPHTCVIENMPRWDVSKFFINNNHKRWANLLNKVHIVIEEDRGAFFKLCYVMGLFNESSSISKRAFNFINEHVLQSRFGLFDYHVQFGELKVYEKGYNEEFCELIFKELTNYQGQDFLFYLDNGLANVRMFSSIYNDFELVKNIYPNKEIHTNRRSDELTYHMCVDLFSKRRYYNINSGNEEFALNIGLYGYSQSEFERAQYLFDVGKAIPKEEISIVANKDDENNPITYELLDKDNPLGVILGNITNCCQTINGIGSSCVFYGLSKKNSKFMVFRHNLKIIGQSWVWYDESTKKICLDNIEIPHKILRENFKDQIFKNEFLKCLKRSVKGFLSAMEERGLEVDYITVGESYNDAKCLFNGYQKLIDASLLSDYSGYSDAKNQFVLYRK